jgi:4,5-DOPA dioxygenase extradiol
MIPQPRHSRWRAEIRSLRSVPLNDGARGFGPNTGMNSTLPWAPAFFSHGSPMTALEPREAGLWWRALGEQLATRGRRPSAVLIASAHSLTREPALLAAPRHEAVYDFGGFDPQLHTLRYDAPGAPALAERAAALLQAAGQPVHVLPQGGLDHGIWVPLRELFPQADVPVLPLAWPPQASPQALFALGQALAPLVAEGVWVVGSGSITHNLRRVFAGGLRGREDAPATPESTAFRNWWAARSEAADWPALWQWRSQAPHAALMHPSDEHLLPFFIAAGAAAAPGQPLPKATREHTSHTFGELAMDGYRFGPEAW